MKQSYDLNTNKTLSTDIECFEDLSKFYITLEKIIFHIDEENLENSVEKTIELFDSNFPYSFNLTICNFVYISFCITHNTNYIYFKYLKSIQTKEEEELNQSYPKIMDMFIEYMSRKKSQESYYLIEKMIELNLINVKNTRIYIFQTRLIAHYKTEEENKHLNFDNLFEETFFENYEELSKNDWELHKKYIKEGHNPNEIAKIIRNDEIEKLQEIATQTNFNFNQTIEPSLYERCSFINEEDVTLIDYAAFFSSIKCFKYLLMNGSNVLNTGKYAVAGGNLEIIHLCEQNHSSFEYAYKTAIQFHRYDIFQYLYENKISQNPNLEKLGKISVSFYNYEIFLYLRKEGMKNNDYNFIVKSIKLGNIYFVILLLKGKRIDVNAIYKWKENNNCMIISNGTVLHLAIQNNNIEIVRLLLGQEGINVNARCIAELSNEEYIDEYAGTALHIAVRNNNIEIVKLLLDKEGIDINAKDSHGSTALILASDYDFTEIAKSLLEQEGIDINAKDNCGRTALMFTSRNGNIEIVKLLLEQEEIDINAKDNIYFIK